MTQAIGFAPTALPTARAPFGYPSRRASALYVTVAPGLEFEQRAPDLHLEVGAADRERQRCRFVTPDGLAPKSSRARRRARIVACGQLFAQHAQFVALAAGFDECQPT